MKNFIFKSAIKRMTKKHKANARRSVRRLLFFEYLISIDDLDTYRYKKIANRLIYC